MNKNVSSFPILFALLALLIGTCAVVFPASAQAAPTSTGSITVSGTVASSYDAYQIFSANVVDGDSDAKIATDLAWASDAVRDAALPVLHSAGMPKSQTTAQEAAEWLNTDPHLTSALSAQLARSLQSSGAVSVALNAGTTAELPCGYWLIVANDDAIAQNEAGTAPIMALVGGSAVTVKPKAATPKVSKHVLEDSTAAWQKAADATVADDLYWRLSATVPAGLAAYDTYAVQFVDTMSAGLDPSKVAASVRVYVAAGTDGGFDAVSAPRAPALSPCTTHRSTAHATTASLRATPTRSTCATRALPLPTSPATPASPTRRATMRAPTPGISRSPSAAATATSRLPGRF